MQYQTGLNNRLLKSAMSKTVSNKYKKVHRYINQRGSMDICKNMTTQELTPMGNGRLYILCGEKMTRALLRGHSSSNIAQDHIDNYQTMEISK